MRFKGNKFTWWRGRM
ncbi:hypothetical protein AALP_AAs58545U000100, partial [Arabis alpina]